MRGLKLSGAIAVIAVSGMSLLPMVASAETDARTKKGCVGAVCFVIGKATGDDRPEANGSQSPAKPRRHDSDHDQKVRETIKKFSTALAVYDRQLSSYNRCIQTFDPSLNKAGCGNAPTPPNAPVVRSDTFAGRGNQRIPITAGQAAAIAVARLQLPKVPPGIGPSPDINPWNMAAVGYPLWLWADGPTHVRVRSKHENCHGESRHLRQDLV